MEDRKKSADTGFFLSFFLWTETEKRSIRLSFWECNNQWNSIGSRWQALVL